MGTRKVLDMDEETPDFDELRSAQNHYEEFLEELDRFQLAYAQGASVENELELIEEDIRDVRSYLKVEIEYLETEDFLVGGNPSNYSEKATELFSPRIKSLEDRFESAERYLERLRNR